MRVLVLLCLGVCALSGQDFEAASVKLSGPQSVRGSSGGPGSRDPERYTYTLAALRDLVFEAFGLTHYREQIDGPGWIDTPGYDVVVKIPPGTTTAQFRQMLQMLLVERFRLKIHHETQVLPVYQLVVAKGGPRMKEAGPTAAEVEPAPPITASAEGFPEMPPGRPGLAANYSISANGQQQSHWRAQQQTMAVFARMLGLPSNAGRIVIDKTGLNGTYDFTFYYDVHSPGAAAPSEPGLTLFDALDQQLGLKLVDAKQPFDRIVIDHAERVPAEN